MGFSIANLRPSRFVLTASSVVALWLTALLNMFNGYTNSQRILNERDIRVRSEFLQLLSQMDYMDASSDYSTESGRAILLHASSLLGQLSDPTSWDYVALASHCIRNHLNDLAVENAQIAVDISEDGFPKSQALDFLAMGEFLRGNEEVARIGFKQSLGQLEAIPQSAEIDFLAAERRYSWARLESERGFSERAKTLADEARSLHKKNTGSPHSASRVIEIDNFLSKLED